MCDCETTTGPCNCEDEQTEKDDDFDRSAREFLDDEKDPLAIDLEEEEEENEGEWMTKTPRKPTARRLSVLSPVDVQIIKPTVRRSKTTGSVSAAKRIKIIQSRGSTKGTSPISKVGKTSSTPSKLQSFFTLYPSFFDWVKSVGSITQGFSNPVTYMKGRTIHGGYDIFKLPIGAPIPAYVSGVVESIEGSAQSTTGWGLTVVLRDERGNRHRYAHLHSVGGLQYGDFVQSGKVFAFMGRSGNVFGKTGIHLHYEIKNATGGLVDPATMPA